MNSTNFHLSLIVTEKYNTNTVKTCLNSFLQLLFKLRVIVFFVAAKNIIEHEESEGNEKIRETIELKWNEKFLPHYIIRVQVCGAQLRAFVCGHSFNI